MLKFAMQACCCLRKYDQLHKPSFSLDFISTNWTELSSCGRYHAEIEYVGLLLAHKVFMLRLEGYNLIFFSVYSLNAQTY